MQRSARWSVSTLILATLASTLSTPAWASAVPLGDGVVVDSARGVAYLTNPGGQMEAVELGHGKVVWSAKMAAKPLAADAGRVVAQVESEVDGSLEIASFDAASGKPGKMKTKVELPSNVKAQLRDTPGKSFRAAARLDGDELVVSWLATAASRDGVARGYLPSIEEGGDPVAAAGSVERLAGAVQVDLDSGLAVEAQAPVGSTTQIEILPAAAVPGASGNLYASADGRHVLASERQIGDDPFQSYRWTLYARDSGERLGEISNINSVAPFVVVGGNLVYLSERSIRPQGKKVIDEPMRLRAVDLARGVQLWSRDVSDSRYRGPLPH